SLTYGTISLILIMSYMVVVGLLGGLLSQYFKISEQPLTVVTVAGSALAILPVRRTVQGWVDRTFYPARRANRAAIISLGHELSGLIDSQSAAETLLTRLAALYRPERLSLFLSEQDGDQIKEVAGICADQPVRPVFSLERSTHLVNFLDRIRRPVFAEDFEEHQPTAAIDRDSLSFLQRLGCELLVPLVTRNQLSGFLSFGPKGSGALYTQDDLANLRLLSVQAAALLESRRLYQESLARKQIETELSVAQQIQERLLPPDPFSRDGLLICGRMDSCHEVGGDYFDYFPLDSQTVGFAIADVSGKGIPAALMMTTLRIAFHGEAVRFRSPERVVNQLNQTVSKLMAEGQFICFFYGIYSLRDGSLRYCNAGMDPPILFRQHQEFLETLNKGGPVLGVNPDYRYRCGMLTLRENDLILGYTDGLTEQTDEAGEFFDVERLVATVKRHWDLPLEELRESIFTTVSEFAGPQRVDDRTVMLLKINPL
ncbi:MAG: GAF domain-containing SpoIIE family protein phosphatase, partial [bacterium]